MRGSRAVSARAASLNGVRLLHTSDWHLGRALRGRSLHQAQADAVRALVKAAVDEQVDVFIVAGDVFDRPVPPIESLRLLNEAVTTLADAGVCVILSAGNHDSGERLGTYAQVLRDGVHVVGTLDSVGTGIELTDEHGSVVVYALPYLHPDVARVALADDRLGEDTAPLARSHEAVVAAALDRIERDLVARGNPRAVVVGHAFVAGSTLGIGASEVDAGNVETTDSERDLSVGGVQIVPAGVFAERGIDYVALGHLHRPQTVRERGPRVAYSGSLLRYSISEAGHGKQARIVEIGAPGADVAERVVDIAQPREMSRVRGLLVDVVGDGFTSARDDFVEVTLTDTVMPDHAFTIVSSIFPHLLEIRYEPEGRDPQVTSQRGDARGRQPIDVLIAFMHKVTGAVPDEQEQAVLARAYERARDEMGVR